MENLFQEAEKVRYRPDKVADIALARVGVFKVVPLADLFDQMVDQKLPKCFFQLEHDRYLPLDSCDLQKNKLRAIKVEKRIRYSGSRRQRKSVITTLYSSEVYLTEHVLKRIYQRSNLRGLNASDLYFPKSAYLEELTGLWSKINMDWDTQLIKERLDFIYPYKSGAFVGSTGVNPNPIKQRFLYTSDGVLEIIDDGSSGTNVFIAKTFIDYEMMNSKQREVYNLWSVGQYKNAAVRMLSIEPCPTKVRYHSTKIVPITPPKIISAKQSSDSDAA